MNAERVNNLKVTPSLTPNFVNKRLLMHNRKIKNPVRITLKKMAEFLNEAKGIIRCVFELIYCVKKDFCFFKKMPKSLNEVTPMVSLCYPNFIL